MFMTEEELSVEVAEIYGVEIDDVDFAKASEDEIFKQFAAYAACADHEHPRLFAMSSRAPFLAHSTDLFDVVMKIAA